MWQPGRSWWFQGATLGQVLFFIISSRSHIVEYLQILGSMRNQVKAKRELSTAGEISQILFKIPNGAPSGQELDWLIQCNNLCDYNTMPTKPNLCSVCWLKALPRYSVLLMVVCFFCLLHLNSVNKFQRSYSNSCLRSNVPSKKATATPPWGNCDWFNLIWTLD